MDSIDIDTIFQWRVYQTNHNRMLTVMYKTTAMDIREIPQQRTLCCFLIYFEINHVTLVTKLINYYDDRLTAWVKSWLPGRYLTEPSASPLTMKRCNQLKTTATGRVASSVAAMTWSQLTL